MNYLNTLNDVYTWEIVSIVIAICGGVVAYLLFVNKKTRVTKALPKLRDILDAEKLYIEHLVRAIYLVLTIYFILHSFGYISVSWYIFLQELLLKPILLRVIYELVIIFIHIWKNTTEIADNVKKK